MILSQLAEAAKNLLVHRGRTFLAALGIIFGVGSVICMLSISEVARRDVVDRIQRLGVQNIVIDSVKPDKIRKQESKKSSAAWKARYGLSMAEFDLLSQTIGPGSKDPAVVAMTAMRIVNEPVKSHGDVADANVVATTPSYAKVMGHAVSTGRFLAPVDDISRSAVCVLGSQAARTLFPLVAALGQEVIIGSLAFQVVGVLKQKGEVGSGGVLANPDKNVWIPYGTFKARFGTSNVVGGRNRTEVELNRAVFRVKQDIPLDKTAAVITSMMKTRHKQDDLKVTIPSALIEEQRQAENVFRWVMGSLAAISLLVGGVGIMNIMLANMAERRQEIGLRRALGAYRSDIIGLFLAESFVLCLFGSTIGVILGAGLAHLVGQLAQWTVAFEPISFPLGIGVGVLTGLIFGTVPAVRAARLDPVLALRVE